MGTFHFGDRIVSPPRSQAKNKLKICPILILWVQKLRMALPVKPNLIGVSRNFSLRIATDPVPKRQNFYFYRRTVDKFCKVNHFKYFITFSEIID
jgi:hypothetical protein